MVDKKTIDIIEGLRRGGMEAFKDFSYVGRDNREHKFYKKRDNIVYELDGVKKWGMKIKNFNIPHFLYQFYYKELEP